MNGCKEWKGSKNKWGYGTKYFQGQMHNAHRAIFMEAFGAIPKGMEVDHICRNRSCVELSHLRLLTHKENSLLGNNPISDNARKTVCKSGHAFTGTNLYINPKGHRQCRSCARVQRAKFNQKKTEEK